MKIHAHHPTNETYELGLSYNCHIKKTSILLVGSGKLTIGSLLNKKYLAF